MVPGEPGQLRAIRTEAGAGVKVVPGDEDLRSPGRQVDADHGIGGFSFGLGMIFTDTKHQLALAINHAIGVAPLPGWGDRFRGLARPLAIEALIGKIRKVDDAIGHGKSPAAVFVDARASVERGRGKVGGLAIRAAAHHHVTPALRRTHFGPVNVCAVKSHLHQTDRLRGNQISRQRRLPGTVRGYVGGRHRLSPASVRVYIV